MALLQISEPGQSPEPHQRKLAVGIDLGTSNSLVAAVRGASTDTLADAEGRVLLPSVVNYAESGILVGHEAQALAAQDPQNTVVSVKRFMGRSLADIAEQRASLPYQFDESTGADHMLRLQTRQGEKSPVSVSADILSVLRERAEQTLGDELSGAVITVPAYFDDAQRQATKDAAQLAGLSVLRLLNEPTAAAIAYGLDSGEEGEVAVYDLGGGTFDISLMRLNKGVFEVMATGGDSALGGDDFDHAIVHWLAEQGVVAQSDSDKRRLLNEAKAAKEALSDADTVEIEGKSLSREQCNALFDPLIEQTLKACKRALRDAKLKAPQLKAVVMVGGSTRVPRVRERVGDLFGCEPLTSIDPDRVVALGAAMQADALVGNRRGEELLLLDVIPLSLGLETMGGLVEKIVQRNTTIPVSMAQEFTTYKDGQTAMAVHVVQGERELVDACRSLARFELRGIPPMVAGAARIQVRFDIDADGLLQVSAREESTGVEASVEVKPAYGLGDDDVANMLRDSWESAAADKEARNLREQQVDAEQLLQTLSAALLADGEALLSEAEQRAILDEMEVLASLVKADDANAIKRQVEAVGKASDEFAARRMDASIRKALAGKSVSALGEAVEVKLPGSNSGADTGSE